MSDQRAFVSGCLQRCVDSIVNDRQDAMLTHEQVHAPESPLEFAFAACWSMVSTFPPVGTLGPHAFVLDSQWPEGKYRVDFRVALNPVKYGTELFRRFKWIAVELDGHEFHEKTKAQVTKRNQRDRDLVAAGWTILRFSGSEFYRDPLGVVDEVWCRAYQHYGHAYISLWREEDAAEAAAEEARRVVMAQTAPQ